MKIYYPKLIVMRWVEHTVYLFFNDVSIIPILNQMITSHKPIWYVPGLGEKFCNGLGTVFVCSPYHLFFNFLYCKFDYIYIAFFYLDCIVYTIIIFPLGRKSVDFKEYILTFSYFDRIILTIIIFLFGRKWLKKKLS